MCLGVPGQVVEIDGQSEPPTGVADFGGVRRSVCLSFTPEAHVGEYVLVHVGFAISVLDEKEAVSTLEILGEMGALSGD